jgi:hypothetical protein
MGQIQSAICKKEPFMGASPKLDILYQYSILLSGIVEHLCNDDNSCPDENEGLLLCLRSLLNKNLCGVGGKPIIDVRNYHIPVPFLQVNPLAGPAFDEGVNQYNP